MLHAGPTALAHYLVLGDSGTDQLIDLVVGFRVRYQ